jgi:hypothetical protein
MNDMTGVITPKSDQINADDLIGRTMNITIREVQIRGGQEQPVSIYFDGSDKAFRPCKSMSRVLVAAWGADAKQYVGRSLTLYRDPTVKWGGMEVGGIRISHMSHLDRAMTMALTATKGSRKPFVVKPLETAPSTQSRPQTEPPVSGAGTFNIIDQDGNPHPLATADAWAAQIRKIVEKMTSSAAVNSFIVRNNPAIADAALTHPDVADEVRIFLMDRKHELEPVA